MMKIIISLIAGIIFSTGLVISGMTNPQKVIGFLDIFGNWDYSLAFVMGGAVGVNLISFRFFLNRKPFLCENSILPTNTIIDKPLIIGAVLFGIGWGILGICPGPGIVNLVVLNQTSVLFVISMIVGMFLFKVKPK